MASSVETDLTQKLETSSLKAAQNEIPIGKDAADMIKAQANEAFKSNLRANFRKCFDVSLRFQMEITRKRRICIRKRSKFIPMPFSIRTAVLLIFAANGTVTR